MAAEQTALKHILAAAEHLHLALALGQVGVIIVHKLLGAGALHKVLGHAVHGLEIALPALGHLVPEALGGGGQVLAHLLLQLVELLGTIGQLNGAADGENVIHQIDAEEEGGCRDGVFFSDAEQPGHHRRIHHMAQQHAGQAEQETVEQADPAVDLNFFLAVIPPAHMKELFHEPAGEILQGGGEDHAAQEGENGVFQASM